ncbi:Cardiolipin synthase [Halomicronema hongdechloris C2206]|uniref:Cardiolipin synthase n=2 Tax=Halomicronema hongdechloris TaxID=1209493 RepID=A0A1Z3HLR3_9CYAN|nr:Cardiolipin synthase [Halomicronema hongdechloris C2206]
MSPGRRADEFAQALIHKAQQGVQVKLIADSYGVKSLPSRTGRPCARRDSGGAFFNRFNWRSPLDYLDRTHRKLLLVDECLGPDRRGWCLRFVGSAPIVGGHHPWLDFEIALEGEVVSVLRGIFLQHWLDTRGRVDFQHRNLTSSPTRYPRILVTPRGGPHLSHSSIRSLLQVAIMAAEHRVWIASPYFLPDLNTRHEMIAAQNRGVDIRILTMGPLTDKPFVYHAAQCRYRQLLQAGIAIHEYQPSMMHSKLLLLDDIWVSIGSANFDPRSFFHNDELNLTTAEPQLFSQVEQFFKRALTACDRITPESLAQRPWTHRLIGQSSLLFYWHL